MPVSVLILLVGQEKGHVAYKKPAAIIFKVVFCGDQNTLGSRLVKQELKLVVAVTTTQQLFLRLRHCICKTNINEEIKKEERKKKETG